MVARVGHAPKILADPIYRGHAHGVFHPFLSARNATVPDPNTFRRLCARANFCVCKFWHILLGYRPIYVSLPWPRSQKFISGVFPPFPFFFLSFPLLFFHLFLCATKLPLDQIQFDCLSEFCKAPQAHFPYLESRSCFWWR